MNASSTAITQADFQTAFSKGADLWVIKNDPKLKWWQELNYRSQFLLTRNYFHSKKEIPPELLDIIKATSLDEHKIQEFNNYVLIGSSDHFLNKWLLVWDDLQIAELCKIIETLSSGLKFDSIRFFSHTDQIKQAFKTRPTASSMTISYIE